MISIVTPFFNAQEFLSDSINSVLNQKYEDWELLLVNDGSTDSSKEVVLSFEDTRLRYFEQNNTGVSAARNVGLANMKGEFFCFLDADDQLTPFSLSRRIEVFETNPELSFVDGKIIKMDHKLDSIQDAWVPSFKGNPFLDLVHLAGKSFFGPSWMIRSDIVQSNRFMEGLTHGEDLLFYLSLAREGGQYGYTEEEVLLYRNNPMSAMKNLKGLENGYRYIERTLRDWKVVRDSDLLVFQWRYKKAMALAYLRELDYLRSLKVWL